MIETNITRRWEKGIAHHFRSVELVKDIKELDYKFGNDFLCIKTGGDGDNGEHLMYLLDIYFENKDIEMNRGNTLKQKDQIHLLEKCKEFTDYGKDIHIFTYPNCGWDLVKQGLVTEDQKITIAGRAALWFLNKGEDPTDSKSVNFGKKEKKMTAEITFKKDKDEVVVHTPSNNVTLNMSNSVFDSLSKIIDGPYDVVEEEGEED